MDGIRCTKGRCFQRVKTQSGKNDSEKWAWFPRGDESLWHANYWTVTYTKNHQPPSSNTHGNLLLGSTTSFQSKQLRWTTFFFKGGWGGQGEKVYVNGVIKISPCVLARSYFIIVTTFKVADQFASVKTETPMFASFLVRLVYFQNASDHNST